MGELEGKIPNMEKYLEETREHHEQVTKQEQELGGKVSLLRPSFTLLSPVVLVIITLVSPKRWCIQVQPELPLILLMFDSTCKR